MASVYLLLGSNEGERNQNLQNARNLIAQRCGEISIASALYQTEAWGIKEQNSFLNQAMQIETPLSPVNLLAELKKIEAETGRVETLKWGPRVIDIDILFYGDQIIDEPQLKVPHPFIQERRFTLIPLSEICANYIHPVLKKSIAGLLLECKDDSRVVLFRG